MFASSLVRGRRPEAFLKVERGRRSRGCARSAVSGGAETARRALRPVREELAARCPGGNAGARKRGPASENRRWSAERRASLIAKGRGAPRTRPGTCSQHVPGGLASTPFPNKINYIAAKPSDFGPNGLNRLGSVCKPCAARARHRLHRHC